MEKKSHIPPILVLSLVLAISLSLNVAAIDHTWSSTGNVIYDDNGTQTTVFNKADLDYLDDRIDTIEQSVSSGKNTIAKKLNEWDLPADQMLDTTNPTFSEINEALEYIKSIPDAGTEWQDEGGNSYYIKEDGSLTTDAAEAKTNEDGNAEPLKIAAATSENLSAGTAAWVNGSLIIGNGQDNASFYDDSQTAEKMGYSTIRVTDKSSVCFPDESQLNPLVPTLTSNTNITGKNTVTKSGSQGYKAFDGDDETYWCSFGSSKISTSNPHWICYQFSEPTSINMVKIIGNSTTVPATIQGSNDGSTWTDIFTVNVNDTDIYHVLGFNEYSDEFLYFRILFTKNNAHWGDSGAVGGTKWYYFVNIYTIQFYKTL